MGWQDVLVALIVLAALGYLGWKVLGPTRRPARLERPDVKSADLVRKKKDRGRS